MFDHTAPEPFNLDAVVDHEKMTDEINAEMERLEKLGPPLPRYKRAELRRSVYDKIRPKYKTYREIRAERG